MKDLTIDTQNPAVRPGLLKQMARVRDKCIECPKCVAECAFLRHYGTPKKIAAAYDPDDGRWLKAAFECSLCGLCAAVCPVDLSPDDMFLEMRREAVGREAAPFPEHKTMLAYEKRGTSRRYSWYSLPENCHTILFPGCTLTGTRPDTTMALYNHLKEKNPDLGIVLDCCCKPSHDLGRQTFFDQMFSEMTSYLTGHNIKTIITACPNCYDVFQNYGAPLEVTTVYEALMECGLPDAAETVKMPTMSIHDPCVLRKEARIHNVVRLLAEARGFTLSEMPHTGKNTLCCGEGGSVGFVSEQFSGNWGKRRKTEAAGRHLLTYCAGCAGSLNRLKVPTCHILDAIFNPKAVAAGKCHVAKAPWTYLNRLRIKRFLKKNHPAPVTRERKFSA